jgi:hypothetical protein
MVVNGPLVVVPCSNLFKVQSKLGLKLQTKKN